MANDPLRDAQAAGEAPEPWGPRLPPLIELAAEVAPDDAARLAALIETAGTSEVAALRVPAVALEAVRRSPEGRAVRLATVLDPEGRAELGALLAEVAGAAAAGADEIDLGLPLEDVLAGDHGVVHERVAAAREVASQARIGLILSARRLTSPVDLTAAARGAIMGGATHLVSDLGAEATTLEATATVLAVLEEAAGRVGLKVPAGPRLEQTGASLLCLVDHFLGPAFATPATLRLVLEA